MSFLLFGMYAHDFAVMTQIIEEVMIQFENKQCQRLNKSRQLVPKTVTKAKTTAATKSRCNNKYEWGQIDSKQTRSDPPVILNVRE